MTSLPALPLIGAEGKSSRLKVVTISLMLTKIDPVRSPIEQNLGRQHPEPPIADA